MNTLITAQQREIVDAVAKLCKSFGEDYWLQLDTSGEFPREFHRAMADGGWLGITMPEEFGGAGMGVTEAALMMKGKDLDAGLGGIEHPLVVQRTGHFTLQTVGALARINVQRLLHSHLLPMRGHPTPNEGARQFSLTEA